MVDAGISVAKQRDMKHGGRMANPTRPNSWTRRSLLRGLGFSGIIAPAACTRAAPAGAAAGGRSGSARNILFFVSDGMNMATLTMAGLFSERFLGRTDPWIGLYDGKREIRRAMMATASGNSAVTDSAAASTAWSSGRSWPSPAPASGG